MPDRDAYLDGLLGRAQPNISLAWIANQLPWKREADREHYLEAFRHAGLD